MAARKTKAQEITVQNLMTDETSRLYGEGKTTVRYQGEIRDSEVLAMALAGASKKANGFGVPEAAIFFEGEEPAKLPPMTKPIALVECKSRGGIDKARKEAQHYIRHCSKKSGLYVPLAIGFDGDALTIDIYDQIQDEFQPCRLPDGSTFMDRWRKNRCWPTQDELLAASRATDGYIRNDPSLMEMEFTKNFIKKINATMQNKNVDITDRVILFTGFLIACRSPGFQVLSTALEMSAEDVGGQVIRGYRSVVKAASKEIQSGLLAFEAYLTPLLETRDGQPTPNGAKAIHDIVFKDIPVICGQYQKQPQEIIAEINGNMFNVVDVYDAFQAYAPSNDLGQYFTPRHVVKAMIRLVEQFRGNRVADQNLNEHDVIYDPACGVGGFLVGALERVAQSRVEGPDRDQIKREFGRRLLGVDPAGKIAAIARVNLWLHGDGTSGIVEASSLERDFFKGTPKGGKIAEIGSLGMNQPTPSGHPILGPIADLSKKVGESLRPTVVLMNPPFPTKENKGFESFEFVEHGLKQLGKGGHLCAVVPATMIVKEDNRHRMARIRILEHAQLLAVVALPPDLFAPGASVQTYLVLLEKLSDDEKNTVNGHDWTKTVLFARCPDDGYAMDGSAKRRTGPAAGDEVEQKKRRWSVSESIGGDLAELLTYTKHDQTSGDWWVMKHRWKGGVNVLRSAKSATLLEETITKGLEWSPEAYLDDQVDPVELLRLSNRIFAEMQAYELVKQVGGLW